MTCLCCGETHPLFLRKRRDGKVFCPNCDPKNHRGKRCPAWEEHDAVKHWRNLLTHLHEQEHPSNSYGSGQTSPVIPGARIVFNGGDQVIPVVSPFPNVGPTTISVQHHGHPGSTDAATRATGHVLENEVALFNRMRMEWMKTRAGQFAVVKCALGSAAGVVNFFPTFEEAARYGYATHGVVPMLIRQVLETDPVINIPTIFKVTDISVPTLDLTGMVPGETRTGKVSFTVQPVKPGGDS